MVSTSAFAEQGDLSLYLGGYTDHVKSKTYGYPKKTYNSANYGAGVSYEVLTDLTLTARVFQNSVYQTSTAASIAYTFIKFHGIELNIQEQAATGYSLPKRGPAGGSTADMNYKTNLGLCYNTREIDLAGKHSPKVCATSNLAGSSGTPFNQFTVYLLIPLTNVLE
jgi:hypothetical protein